MPKDFRTLWSAIRTAFACRERLESHVGYVLLLVLAAIPIILSFAWINWRAHHEGLAMLEAGIVVLLLPAALMLHFNWHARLATLLFIGLAMTLFLALFIDGGIAATGNIWLPILPFVTVLAMGLRAGSAVAVAGLLGIYAIAALHAFGLLSLPYSDHEILITCAATTVFTGLGIGTGIIRTILAMRERRNMERLRASEEALRRAHAELEVQVAERTAHLARAKKRLEKEIEEKEQANERLRQTQEKFFQAQKMEAIGTLVGGIAHDFNNMLSGITANLYLVRARTEDAASLERLQKVDTLIMHAADMIRQMLTFARKDQIQLREFELNAFIKEAYKLARVSISEAIHTSLTLPEDPLYIRGDATQLQQVLMNLMNNARDALEGRADPQIHVSLRCFRPDAEFRSQHPEQKAKAYACLSVRDNGHGIPEEKLDQIFEPFFTTKAEGRGTGLGLAMIYGAVESHGGVIEVKSRVGHGTTFMIYLPTIARTEDTLLGGSDDAVVHGQGETLLLVDDDEFSRQANAEVLQSLNYNVIEAANGIEAIRIFEREGRDIDLILMDVVMPGMGGVEAARRIRSINSRIGIIFITGYDKNKTLNGEITGEWENFITKPLTVEKLSSTIHRYFLRQLSNTHSIG